MTASQTGFVRNMGIQVNLVRALERIEKRITDGKIVYGLFLDFANAYNSVPHVLLFKKLREKAIFEEKEVNYLQAMYARYRIKIGSNYIRYNKGVAQGSVISPGLFNIFIEDLATELQESLGIGAEDILLYADDVLILCNSIELLHKAIKIVDLWSKKNGMELNKKKSAIVPFAPRKVKAIPFLHRLKNNDGKAKEWIVNRKELDGVPIVLEYKYLGTFLNFKLTTQTHMEAIRKKSDWIFIRLYPYLAQTSMDARRDMWATLIFPLFHGIFPLMTSETSVSALEKIYGLIKKTFKKMLLLPQSTSSEIIYEMIGVNPVDLVKAYYQEAVRKWTTRRNRSEWGWGTKIPRYNILLGVPNNLSRIIKMQCKICLVCKRNGQSELMSAKHMEDVHNIEIYCYKKLWIDIREYYVAKWHRLQEKKKSITSRLKRSDFADHWTATLEKIEEINKTRIEEFLGIHKIFDI